jgi:hypothetical protein
VEKQDVPAGEQTEEGLELLATYLGDLSACNPTLLMTVWRRLTQSTCNCWHSATWQSYVLTDAADRPIVQPGETNVFWNTDIHVYSSRG